MPLTPAGKKLILGALVLLCIGISVRPAQADLTGNVNVFLGAKALEKDDWEPVENQAEFAVEFDFRERTWPINLVIGLRGAHAEDDTAGPDTQSTTGEFSLGVRKIWDSAPHIRPFLGAGLALIGAEIEAAGFGPSSSGGGVGIWLGGGVYWTLTTHFNLGFDLRVSGADASMEGTDRKAGGVHLGLLLGYHF